MFNSLINYREEVTIHTSAFWNADDIRQFCIDNKYYARGNNADYGKMLDYVRRHNPTTEALYIVARNIVEHSDMTRYDCDMNTNIASVMYEITRKAVHVLFNVDALPF